MGSNKVYIAENGIVEIIVNGDQTVESVRDMGTATYRLCDELRSADRPALILDNLLAIGVVPTDARSLVVELIKSEKFDKLAMVGSDTLLRFGANLMLQATGKGSRVKYFDSRSKAESWLLRTNRKS